MKLLLTTEFKSVSDIHNDVLEVENLVPKYEKLCGSLLAWKDSIEENDSQLKILEDTGQSLSLRQQKISHYLASAKTDPKALNLAHKEFHIATKILSVWFRELADVNKDREDIIRNHSLNCHRQRTSLQRSMTNVELAKFDLERLEKRHQTSWKRFLRIGSDLMKKTSDCANAKGSSQ